MKMIDVLHMPRQIWLGRKTEQNFRPIAFDVYKWLTDYPEATVSIVYTRPDGQVFPVASSDRSPIIWIPQQDVTTVSGEGEIELHLVGGGAVGISASTKTLIDDSAASAQPTAPSWVDQVVQDVTEQADRAEEAADSIGGAIDEAVAEAVPTAVADYIEEHPIEVTETDPTVPAWAKQPTKPTYTAAEVHALPDSTVIPDISGKVDKVTGKGLSTNDFTNADKTKLDGIESGAQKNTVTSVNGMTGDVVVSGGGGDVSSVNGKTGAVVLNASDVGALPSTTAIPNKTSDLTNDSGFQTAPLEIPISDDGQGNYTTTATAQDIYDNAENCVIVFGIYRYAPTRVQKDTSNESANILINVAADINSTLHVAEIRIHAELPSTITIAVQDSGFFTLPAVTATDNGKFLRVSNGAWAAATIPAAESNSFGGGA